MIIKVHTKGEGPLIYYTNKYVFNKSCDCLFIADTKEFNRVIIPMDEIVRIEVISDEKVDS